MHHRMSNDRRKKSGTKAGGIVPALTMFGSGKITK